ncbi:hypothetical protein CC1G_14787 [Coprinopsis cinerea okayama7|uniref:Uncharacterized protein n=1 Tax=Coprinopsis cinerea (strain Okayama-7 / 130 / ATCC MYA-4618 / FGSC 9003) TaxID=240176 RepID=D6RNG8_COPC7|nr:hypothetical protein CC1G_14787 [Coprinopsis cinerea okayama7\|eukprot:XP_002910809.1 hypothetical protein CC1G_14787 [Coprinopsis cinerea okayama7\
MNRDVIQGGTVIGSNGANRVTQVECEVMLEPGACYVGKTRIERVVKDKVNVRGGDPITAQLEKSKLANRTSWCRANRVLTRIGLHLTQW